MQEGSGGSASASLGDRLAALVGRPVGSRGPSVAPDPVNQPMIRHWAAAFEDPIPSTSTRTSPAGPASGRSWPRP